MKTPSPKALDLILKYEVGGGKSYYDRFLAKPTWPGGASGMTLGIGVDCGYYTPAELEKIFNFLPKKQLEIVKGASGKKGQAGKAYTQQHKAHNIYTHISIEKGKLQRTRNEKIHVHQNDKRIYNCKSTIARNINIKVHVRIQ